MTGDRLDDAEDRAVLAFLAAQREAVLAIVAGLDEDAWHRSVVPSGWTPAGLVDHLGGAEWHWFQGVVAGAGAGSAPAEDLPPYDPSKAPAFITDLPAADIVSFYRDQCARSDAVLAITPLSARPRGRHGGADEEPPDVRWVVLHMIEETARHAGHLDIARELIDGQTGLGPR